MRGQLCHAAPTPTSNPPRVTKSAPEPTGIAKHRDLICVRFFRLGFSSNCFTVQHLRPFRTRSSSLCRTTTATSTHSTHISKVLIGQPHLMVFCHNCSQSCGPGDKFCGECGTKLLMRPGEAKRPPLPAGTPPPRGKTVGRSKSPPRSKSPYRIKSPPVRSKSPARSKSPKRHGGAAATVGKLTAHEQWVIFDSKLRYVSGGYGIPSLKAALPVAGCVFAVFRLSAENVGNVGKGIVTKCNIILQWRGPRAQAMAKVKFNSNLQAALKALTPNKGFIEVLGTRNLSTSNIYDRWRPGSGSKVIQD